MCVVAETFTGSDVIGFPLKPHQQSGGWGLREGEVPSSQKHLQEMFLESSLASAAAIGPRPMRKHLRVERAPKVKASIKSLGSAWFGLKEPPSLNPLPPDC